MTDLKKLKKLNLELPKEFEETVWRTIATRTPRQTETLLDWGDLLMRQPSWAMGLACVVLLTGLTLGRITGSYNTNPGANIVSDQYVNLYNQTDNIL